MHNHDLKESFELGRKSLIVVVVITFCGSLLEIWGSAVSGSVALWSDAWHMLADSSALIFSLAAVYLIKKFPNGRHFGEYHFAEVAASAVNCFFIFIVDFSVFWRICGRLQNPNHEVSGNLMLAVSCAGLLANLAAAYLLWRPGKSNFSIRGAFWHVLSDGLCSVAVIIGAVIIIFTKLYWLDVLISMIIGVVIFIIGLNLAKKLVKILRGA
jgi:cobalt-zinc-cadmium efflux system protein